MSRFLEGAAALILAATPALAQQDGTSALGREATAEEIAAWDIDVRPDGQGAPEGAGGVMEGEEIYMNACSSCHGVFGEGQGRWPPLMGGKGTLDGARPVKTIGSYWPYLSTVWDYVHRAMPFGSAQSLTDDEVYAVTAYLLYLNDEVDQDFELSAANIGEVELPNEDGFFMDDRAEVELPRFSREPCMSDCKNEVEITMRAAVLDVTPDAEDTDEAPAAHDEPASGEEEAAAPADDAATGEQEDEVAMLAADPERVGEGESLFRQCQACHQVGEGAQNRSGPHLNAVFGREAGGVEGFRYSPAMEQAGAEGLTWDAESLEAFLADPRGYIQGTRMVFRGMDESDIPALLAYLASFEE